MKNLLAKSFERSNSLSLLFLLFLALGSPLIYTNHVYIEELYNLPKFIFANLMLIFLIFISVSNSMKIGNYSINLTPFFFPFSAYILAQIISSCDSANYIAGISEITHFIFLFLITFFVANHIKSKRDIVKILNSLFIAASVTSIVGLFQYFRLFGFEPLKDTYDADTYGSFMGHANFAAAFLITVIPAMIVMIIHSLKLKKKGYAIFLIVNLLLTLSMLYITFTRSSWMGLSFGLLFFIFLPKFRKQAILLLIVLLILTSAIGSFIKDHEGKTLIKKALSSFDLEDDPIQFRLFAWSSTLKIIRDHFLNGVGGGNFRFMYPKYRLEEESINTGLNKEVTHTHNDYLQIATDYGIIGFFAFLWILTTFIFIFFRILKKAKDPFVLYVNLGMGCGIIALIVDMIFNFSLYLPASSISFFILLGLISSLDSVNNERISEIKNQDPDKNIFPSHNLKGSLTRIPTLILIILFILSIFLVIKPLIASFYTMKSMYYESLANKAETSKEMMDNLSTSSKYLNKALFLTSRDIDLRYISAVFNNFLGLYQKSNYDIDICIKQAPYTPVYHCLKGINYYNMGDIEKAEKEILFSLKYDNLFFISQAAMGNIYRIKNEFNKAIEHYNKAQKLKSDSLFPQIGIATVSFEIAQDFLENRKDIGNARKWFLDAKERYLKVIKVEEDNVKVLNNLGVIEFRLGDSQKALEFFKKAEEFAPNHPSTNTNLGMLYDISGNEKKAIYHFKKVLKYIPHSPLRYRLAQLLKVPVTALDIKPEQGAFSDPDKSELNKLWMDDNFQMRKRSLERKQIRTNK